MPPAASATEAGLTPTRPTETRRFYELDSLRGLAALTVVFGHFFNLTSPRIHTIVNHSPLKLLIDAHQAVVLFFVLSGFVLTLPYTRRSSLDYPSFLLKRVCRIYLPYLAALALSLAGDLAFPHVLSANPWINYTWTAPVTPSLVIHHILFLGNYDSAQINTAFWSLIHEMRISLIFPFLALATLRWRLRRSLALALALSATAFILLRLLTINLHVSQESAYNTVVTLHYTAFFILGALLARCLHRIDDWYRTLTPSTAAFAGLVTLILYAYSTGPTLRHLPPDLYDWLVAPGALGLIVLAINCGPLHRFLTSRLVHHLGKVSYSLYLVHGTVLFTLIHLCLGRIPLLAILALYLPITLVVTELFYRFVEQPTMALGRRLTSSGPLRKSLPDQVPAP